jgi:polysaccharide deacetylase 2 family uncharacterized protein YibQ
MRFRRSHHDRQHVEEKTFRYDLILRYALIIIVGVTVLGWGGWMLFSSNDPLGVRAWFSDQPATVYQKIDTRTAGYKSDQDAYEEMELALAQAFNNLQVAPQRIKERQPWLPYAEGAWQPAQRTVRVSAAYALTQCNQEIFRVVRQADGEVVGAIENTRTRELTLQIACNGKIMHELTIIRDPSIPRKTGRMALIIEDLGAAPPEVRRRLLAIDRKLTFGIVPWREGAAGLADEAKQRHHEVVLQLPMEPYEYPRVTPGRRAVYVHQTEPQNRQVVRDAIGAVSAAGGLMSYMGGRILGDARVMPVVLDEVRRHDKFFIDAPSLSGSIASALARKSGIRGAASWGAIDAVDNQERIATMLDLASYAALDGGEAIVTAHARPGTLTVLLHKLERLELRGIQFVPVSDLVEPAEE